MRRTVTTTTLALAGALLLTGGIGAQEWPDHDHDHDLEDHLQERLVWLSARLDRVGERIGRVVSRSVTRALRDVEIRIELDDDWWDEELVLDLDEEWHGGRWEEATVTRFQEGREFSWAGDLGPGQVIEIKGVNGPIIAERGEGSRVEVRAEKRGRRSDPESVRIDVVEHGEGVTICAVYPTPRGERENRCAAGSGSRMNVRDNDVRVTFRVRVPEGVTFSGRSVNGGVEARDLASDVRVRTVNGDVDISTTGLAEARTVNGSIEARFDSGELQNGVEFETVNGSIRLDVPDDIDADLDARWVNGGLESDLPLAIRGRLGRRHAEGRLGQGGPRLTLKTVNGSITIR